MSELENSAARRQVVRPAAYCVIWNERGEILLTEWQRGDRGGWTLPGGGLDFGESPDDAAVREVYEETGLHVALSSEPKVVSQHFSVGEIADDAEFQAIRFIYRAQVLSGTLQIIDVGGTTTDLGWFSPEEAEALPLSETAAQAMRWFPHALMDSVDHVQLAIPIGGEDTARAFWCEVLGMREVEKPAALAARGGAHFLSAGGTGRHLAVHVGVEADFRPARKAHPAFRCADTTAIARALTNAGHEVRWSEEIPGVRRFHTDDPFNNRLEFTE